MKGLIPTWSHRLRRLTAGDSLRVQLLRGGIGSLAVKATNAVLGFALAIVLARALGPEGYGVYSFALAIVMLAAIPAQVGVPQLVVRETAKAQAKEDWGLMRGLWRWANRAVIIFSFFGAIATGAVLWLMDHVEGGRAATMGIGGALIPLSA